MEKNLRHILKDCSPGKHAQLKTACQDALDLLGDSEKCCHQEAHQLRAKCLLPVRLALESTNGKLSCYAVNCLQSMMREERFHSAIESEQEDLWLPMQVIHAVASIPRLSDEIQIEVMKVLLNMTFSTVWCMNAKVIISISELFFHLYLANNWSNSLTTISKVFSQILGVFYQRQRITGSNNNSTNCYNDSQVCIDVYCGSSHSSIRTAVQATLTQLLTTIAERLSQEDPYMKQTQVEDALSDFSSSVDSMAVTDSLTCDVITILQFLCNKITESEKPGHGQELLPLLLEGVYAMLSNIPESINTKPEFTDLLWKQLCPSLIWLLGNPSVDKSITSQKTGSGDEIGRGSGCSSSAPRIIGPAAKTVYSIAVELVRLVGSISSLRPVLQSVFHRMLLYLPPHHRLEALKSVKELLTSPENLFKVAGPTQPSENKDSRKYNTTSSDMALLRLMVDSMQESCQCNDSAVCTISVTCIDLLLKSVEQLCHGEGLSAQSVEALLRHYEALDKSPSASNTMEFMSGKDTSPDACSPTEGVSVSSPTEGVSVCSPTEGADISTQQPTKETDCKTSVEDSPTKTIVRSNLIQIHRDMERTCAKDFVVKLLEVLPEMLGMYSATEVDEALQQFASGFCSGLEQERITLSDSQSTIVAILNADGVYITAYYMLLLNLKLIKDDFYISSKKSLVSEEQFIDDILGSGLLLYVSNDWLSEVYRQVLRVNVLQEAGYDDRDLGEVPLIQLITEIDGLGSRKISGQLMTDCAVQVFTGDDKDKLRATEAGLRFARQILVTCWEGILDVLCVLLSGDSSCGITMSLALLLGTDSAKEEALRARQAICTSLDGLQRAARLTCTLGLQNRCGALFEQLANASCVIEDQKVTSPSLEHKLSKTALLQSKPKPARLHTACVLSMDAVLSTGLEMGSHSPDCWKHVFRCCSHVGELEHMYFSRDKPQTSTLSKYQTDGSALDDQGEIDLMMPVTAPVAAMNPQINVADFINESSVEAGWESTTVGGGVLSSSQTNKTLCGLSQYIDRLFEDSARTLNLQALVSFLTELCKASHQQLFSSTPKRIYVADVAANESGIQPGNVLHLYRLADVLLNVVNGNRPLMHIMKAWSAVSSHLVEAACHRDRSISKKAVACMHECVTSLLSNQPELPHFYLNEFLCKPFENLLCLELCDGDVQDQIVCSICELVEACSSEIKSGWRPLFAALRSVRIEYTASEEVNDARQRHVAAVLDVFEVFLNTDNVLVFANAAMDCVLCLLKYVRGPGESDDSSDSDSDSGSDLLPLDSSTENLCLPALKYLQRCCVILGRMWSMPACPVFSGAHRLRLSDKPKCVDRVIPDMNLKEFKDLFTAKTGEKRNSLHVPGISTGRLGDLKAEEESHDTKSVDSGLGIFGQLENNDHNSHAKTTQLSDQSKACVTSASSTVSSDESRASSDGRTISGKTCNVERECVTVLTTTSDSSNSRLQSAICVDYTPVALHELDNPTGILRIWYLVIEGLATAVSSCPKNYQSQTVDMLFELLSEASQADGCVFSLHCMNHLVLPMLQSWLRTNADMWDHTLANFKQYCGLCADLAVEYLVHFIGELSCQNMLEFMLQQLFDVLVECVAQSTESVSRLGCACIRHTLLSAGPLFSESMWSLATAAIQKAFDITTYPMQQLRTLYEPYSENFYGDTGQVKVAARRVCSGMECERMRQLALQVFLLDSQRTTCTMPAPDPEDNTSYVFLLYPPGAEHSDHPDQLLVRVPFSSIVVGLLSHQLLLQTVGCVLLQGASHCPQGEQHVLPSSPTKTTKKRQNFVGSELISESKLPGVLKHMKSKDVSNLLTCLHKSYNFSCDFDLRPGLKFLIQKVIGTEVAANLYKQAGVSMTFYVHTLLEICAIQENITVENVRKMVSKTDLGGANDESSVPSVSNSGAGNLNLNNDVNKDDQKTCGDNSKSEHIEDRSVASVPISSDATCFMKQLRSACDALCQKYVDLLYDKEGEASGADRIANQPLFFLVAQPDDLPKLKRDKQISEIVKEKLESRRIQGLGAMATTAVNQQDELQGEDIALDNGSGDVLPPGEGVESDEEAHKHKADQTKIYNIATGKTIHHLMMQYKKRKQVRAMPSFVKACRQKPAFMSKPVRLPSKLDPEIEQQQKESIIKDADAHIQSWTEMLCTLLELLDQLPDYQFQALLPAVYPCNNQLICHARDGRLKEILARWMYRMGQLYDIVPT